jgi:potassium-transporting ATPase potassium-binding subunit
MTANGWLQIVVFLALILAVTKPMGVFMARVFNRERTFLDPVLRPVERLLYRLTGVDETHEMRWTEYAAAMLLFSVVSMLLLYLIERVQGICRSIRRSLRAVTPDALAFNTAASFTTNTNWQAYSGESTMSYFTQMAGWLTTTLFPLRPASRWRLRLFAASRAGRCRPSETSGSIWFAPACGCCCRSRLSARCCWSRRA